MSIYVPEGTDRSVSRMELDKYFDAIRAAQAELGEELGSFLNGLLNASPEKLTYWSVETSLEAYRLTGTLVPYHRNWKRYDLVPVLYDLSERLHKVATIMEDEEIAAKRALEINQPKTFDLLDEGIQEPDRFPRNVRQVLNANGATYQTLQVNDPRPYRQNDVLEVTRVTVACFTDMRVRSVAVGLLDAAVGFTMELPKGQQIYVLYDGHFVIGMALI